MPGISAFYGIVVFMYWNEGEHSVAHFHAHHAGRRASVSVDGEVLAGGLEPRALAFVREWARIHRDELGPIGSARAGPNPWCRLHRCLRMISMTYLPAIVGAAVIGEHRIRLLFDDGTVGDVDFSSREWSGVFEPLRDPAYFSQVRVDPEAATPPAD